MFFHKIRRDSFNPRLQSSTTNEQPDSESLKRNNSKEKDNKIGPRNKGTNRTLPTVVTSRSFFYFSAEWCRIGTHNLKWHDCGFSWPDSVGQIFQKRVMNVKPYYPTHFLPYWAWISLWSFEPDSHLLFSPRQSLYSIYRLTPYGIQFTTAFS